MSWLVLFGLTATLLLLPWLPALAEWRRPARPQPAPAAGDTPDVERHAAARLAPLRHALAHGLPRAGLREIVHVPAPWVWPLTDDEAGRQRSHRIWYGPGDLMLPRAMHFAAEVVADGHLHSAPHGRHHALWAGRRLVLAERAQVDRWAHGEDVEAGTGCRLLGPVSATRGIVLAADVAFTRLQAAEVRVDPPAPARPSRPAPQPLPEAAQWDARTGRALYRSTLDIGDGFEWDGDVVGHGDIHVGHGCAARGSLKAHGELHLGDDCEVSGSVVAEGRIVLGAGCRIAGPVVSEAGVEIGPGCSIGAPGRPATVAAPRLRLAAGVVVHGALDASVEGRTG